LFDTVNAVIIMDDGIFSFKSFAVYVSVFQSFWSQGTLFVLLS